MRKIAVFAGTIALLTACATQQLNQGLQNLVGSNIRTAISAMGYPDGEREVMGDKIYTWSTNRNAVMPLITTSTTTGMVGSTPVYGTTSATHFVPVAFACTVQIAVTPDGTIKSFQWEGNEGGCQRYARGFH